MREKLVGIVSKMLSDLQIAPENPAVLFDLVTECQAAMESEKSILRELILAKKKEEYYQTLINNKKLGIK